MSEDFNGVQASLQVPGFKQLCHCHTFPDTLTKSLSGLVVFLMFFLFVYIFCI